NFQTFIITWRPLYKEAYVHHVISQFFSKIRNKRKEQKNYEQLINNKPTQVTTIDYLNYLLNLAEHLSKLPFEKYTFRASCAFSVNTRVPSFGHHVSALLETYQQIKGETSLSGYVHTQPLPTHRHVLGEFLITKEG